MIMKNKKGAMEMSVGTIVTIVLLMSVLVLGIFMIQNIFKSSSGAIDSIDASVEKEINKLFGEEGKELVIFPISKAITIERGSGDAAGFAFVVKNTDIESHQYTYTISALSTFDFEGKCGSTMNEDLANRFLLIEVGAFKLGPGAKMPDGELVLFIAPKSAPSCIIPYRLEIEDETGYPQGSTIFVKLD